MYSIDDSQLTSFQAFFKDKGEYGIRVSQNIADLNRRAKVHIGRVADLRGYRGCGQLARQGPKGCGTSKSPAYRHEV